MSDTGLESAIGSTTAVQPEPKVEGTTGQLPSGDIETLKKRVETAEAALRALQSDKDRGVKRVEKQLSEFTPILEQVKALMAQGVTDPDQIQRELEWQEIRKRTLGEPQPASPTANVVGNDKGAGLDAMLQQVATGLGMNIDDPDVANVVRTKQGADAVVALAELAKVRATTPNPSPSITAAVQGGVVQSEGDKQEALVKKLGELQKNPTLNSAEIKSIKKQLGW